MPPIPGLDATPFLTNETIFDLRENVPHLLIVGSGPIGCEMAQAFRRLGSEVTVVDIAPSILPREDRDLAAVVHHRAGRRGRALSPRRQGRRRRRIEGRGADDAPGGGRQRADAGRQAHLLLAAGRRANVEGLGLDAAGVAVEQGRIVSTNLVTTNPRILVAATLPAAQQFTHVAEHHAGIVLRRAIFRMAWAKPSTVIPWCTYTDPELARVGLSETEAKQQGVAHRVYRFRSRTTTARGPRARPRASPRSSPTPAASCSARRSWARTPAN